MPNQSPLFDQENLPVSNITKEDPKLSRMRRQFESPPTRSVIMQDARKKVEIKGEISFVNFKGIIQDVQVRSYQEFEFFLFYL